MAAIDLVEYGNVEEKIETLIFRNSAYVQILKTLREKTFSLGVDIIIRSIDYNLQEDSKTAPPLQFYGFATLVFQDCLAVEIPIRFPRQRIYYDRQWEAFRQWRHWVEFYQQYQFHRKNDMSLASIMGALELSYEELEVEIKENAWQELPLREVLFKGKKNCQFEIEFTRWQPIPFIDPITGLTVDGKSNQSDGDKDGGLPKSGIQPKSNSPSNPFGGNPPTTSIQEAGQRGFDITNSIDDLSNIDPDNLPAVNPPTKRCSVTATARWKYPDSGAPIGDIISIRTGEFVVPFDDDIQVEAYADASSSTGFYEAIKFVGSNQYWDGGANLVSFRSPWTREGVTVVADCTLPV